MKRRGLLIRPTDNSSKGYIDIYKNNSAGQRRTRWLIYNLWDKYQEYADPHFVNEFHKNIDSRFWEMYVTVLLSEEYADISSGAEGPDILINGSSNPVWIEAVNPTAGKVGSPDAVPDVEDRIKYSREFVDERITLRLASAIKDKLRQHEDYLKKGLVADADPYIIAINGCSLKLLGDLDNRSILRTLFPIGHEFATFDRQTGLLQDATFEYKSTVQKSSGSPVRTDIFFDKTYAGVSGILFSRKDCCNISGKCGEEMILIHNPLAKNPLQKDFIPFANECYSTIRGNQCILTYRQPSK